MKVFGDDTRVRSIGKYIEYRYNEAEQDLFGKENASKLMFDLYQTLSKVYESIEDEICLYWIDNFILSLSLSFGLVWLYYLKTKTKLYLRFDIEILFFFVGLGLVHSLFFVFLFLRFDSYSMLLYSDMIDRKNMLMMHMTDRMIDR